MLKVFFLIFSAWVLLTPVSSAEVARTRISRGRLESSPHSYSRASEFTNFCVKSGVHRTLCDQMTRPNTSSKGTFRRIYGDRPFVLMPGPDAWGKGVELAKVAQSLSRYGKICEIRNWYRPEPYNRAVGGARGSQHKSGSAIDIEFCSVAEKRKALIAALKMRNKCSMPKGVGVYGEGSLVIHIDLSNRIYGPGISNYQRRSNGVDIVCPDSNSNTAETYSSPIYSQKTFTRGKSYKKPKKEPKKQSLSCWLLGHGC